MPESTRMAAEVAAMLEDGKEIACLTGNIPGSIDAPAGQMLHYFDDLVRKPMTKVVVSGMSEDPVMFPSVRTNP